MPALSQRQQIILGIVLVLVMVATRGRHVATLSALPDASWAVLLLAGCLLGSSLWFLVLVVAATLTDMAVWTTSSSGDFCITAAYGFLLPAYGALWLGGRWLGRHLRGDWGDLLRYAAVIVASAFVAELFSSGGFYFLSGRFAETSLTGFGERLVRYFPGSLEGMSFYAAIAALVYTVVTVLKRPIATGVHPGHS